MKRLSAELLIILSFTSLILVGTLLLLLPLSVRSEPLSLIDALFTATSAACVTGLIVVDTGSYFSAAGHLILALIIQIGGLGIITISSFFAILLGKRMPLRQREVVRQTHSSLDMRSFLSLVKRIVAFTFVFEGAGALALSLLFLRSMAPFEAIRQGFFHAVSAFCNAGFSLWRTSLLDFRGDWAVNLVFILLIVIGGLGFFVIYDLERHFLEGFRLSLHTKLALFTSGILVVGGAALFLLLESGNLFSPMGWSESVAAALFQSVTARTAGFQTVDLSLLTNSSLVLLMILMFIGGSPGSTAGGIKTTTFALLVITGWNRLQGRTSSNVWNRTIPERIVNQMISITLVSLLLLFCFYFTLQWSETSSVPHSETAGALMEYSFEAISAFGTVGLSLGVTGSLTLWGKVQIILLMFIGRVGPLAIAVAIAKRYRFSRSLRYYQENVMVG